MADIINLRRARKQKARMEDAKLADVNRAKFGQSKAEKQITKIEQARAQHILDGHKRETE
jgi:Domain of unknown function (DUF4169)